MNDPMQGLFGDYKPTTEQSESHVELRERVATLEAELAAAQGRVGELEKENNEAQESALENLGRFLYLAKQCPTALVANQTELTHATLSAVSAEYRTLRAALRQCGEAIKRLMVYVELHRQAHPEWNGNRFDDQECAKAALALAPVREAEEA